jgi:uncharacterized protein (DUF58 family)
VTRRRRLSPDLRPACAFLAVAALGCALSSQTFALVGFVGASAMALLWVWQRSCLSGVSYTRRLPERRVAFGSEATLEVEIVNDKVLPLSCLEIRDAVPATLAIAGIAPTRALAEAPALVQVLPLLPYQRIRRRYTLSCTARGEHRFGPATLTSGDPLGWRTRRATLAATTSLAVEPKIFTLEPPALCATLVLGEHRSPRALCADPTRIAGVRPYAPGDPLRHLDWRASARNAELLVRTFQPTVSPKVAVILEVVVPQQSSWRLDPDEAEFVIAAGASLVTALVGEKVPVGLYSSGRVAGQPVAEPPSATGRGPAAMLEALSRLETLRATPIAPLLVQAAHQLGPETSLVVVSGDYPPPLRAALAEARRRHRVTAWHLAVPGGRAPDPSEADACWHSTYVDDWKSRTHLEIVP